jgi:photosystem II stability/assembly factor-like uncharacterized protein
MPSRRLAVFILFAVAAAFLAFAQTSTPIAANLLNGLEWRGIGPAATGGRIADLAVSKVPGQPAEIYVATTSGGVFKSVNEGVSFTPIFDHAGGMMSIGAVAVAPANPAVVWVGTGEADNRQSSSWGDGVYKSTNRGVTWQRMGLEETRHIARIVIHPTDPNTVYIAAAGHLWGGNPERGVFKTSDGGKTWKKVLYKDENTGVIDLAMDPKNPGVLFAAMYQHQRKGWGFNGGGPGSGIFRTSDGGTTWTELRNGLPIGDKGRIGLTIFPGDNRMIYAIVEAAEPGPGGTVPGNGVAPAGVTPARGGGRGGRGGLAGTGPAMEAAGVEAAPIASRGGGVFRSLDQGETWEHMSSVNPRPMYYSRIYTDPRDANRVYLMGSNRGLYVSEDAGRSFRDVFSNVHGEDHALWIDPDNPNHLVIGGDGGVSISYDRGLTWLFRLNLPIGQFYNISANNPSNNQDPFLVCGGLQDNGCWCTPTATNIGYGISFKDAFNIGGGDGMHAVFDGDDHTVLVSSQNGVTSRLDLNSMERQSIGPVLLSERPQPGKPAYRWYWTTPLIVSSFDSNIIYTGANMLFRSGDRGMNWQAISPDLTANIDRDTLQMMGGPVPAHALSRHDGQANFSALTAIAESPRDRNLLYTGADDGTVQLTRDGGQHWTNLTANIRGLPPMLNISGIVASKFAAGRVYLTVDGHFNDDYHPYVFVSEDFGQNWRAIVDGLPMTSVHRIREHPANPNFLVAGLEMGAFATFDRGAHWTKLGASFPPVPVYDLAFQERAGALVAGTHGRSIWVLDHIESLSQLTPEVLGGGAFLFPPPPAYHQNIYGGQFWFGAGEFFAPNPPFGAVLTYYLPPGSTGQVQIDISDSSGKLVRALRGPARPGLNRTCWDLRQSSPLFENGPLQMGNCSNAGVSLFGGRAGFGPVVMPGKYTVLLTPEGAAPLRTDVPQRTELTILPDPHFTISDADRTARQSALMSAYTLQRQLAPAREAAQALSSQIAAIRQYLNGAGESGRPALAALDRAAAGVPRAQNQEEQAMSAANTVQTAIDGYAGLPTGSQLRQLDWAWEDAAAVVSALNQVIQHDMPAVYAALDGSIHYPEIKPVPALVRPK